MASVQYRTLKDGSRRYFVMYRDPSHKQVKVGSFKRKGDAVALKAQIELDLRNGEYIDPHSGEITVNALAETWLKAKSGSVKENYLDDLRTAWRVHVQPVFGHRAIKTIRKSEVQTWVADMGRVDEKRMAAATTDAERFAARAKSPTTIIRAFGVLKGICDMARDDGIIRRSPTDGVDTPKKTAKRRVYLTAEQVLDLADCSGYHKALILTLGFCGLRWGEAAALRVDDVDMERCRLRIHRSWTRSGTRHYETMPKTWEVRDVPVPEQVMDAIIESIKGRHGEDLVFTDPDGERIREQVASKRPKRAGAQQWYGNALRDAGLPELTCHDLRHTAASIAVSAGANVKALQRMLGHKSAAMTLDRYADLFDTDLDEVAVEVSGRITEAEAARRSSGVTMR